VSKLSRDIHAVAGEVAGLRADIDRFRAELRTIVEQILDDNRLQDIRTARSAVGMGPPLACTPFPAGKGVQAVLPLRNQDRAGRTPQARESGPPRRG
jgi:hypothetical protein